MKDMQTPLHKVRGMGSAHSGTGHFYHERLSSIALIPLTLWFGYAILGLVYAKGVDAIGFLAQPINTILMAGFVVITLYHIKLGLQVVIDDYVHSPGIRIFLLLLVRFVVIATGSTALYALFRITSF